MLIEETLFGKIDKVQQAIDFLREHEPKDDDGRENCQKGVIECSD